MKVADILGSPCFGPCNQRPANLVSEPSGSLVENFMKLSSHKIERESRLELSMTSMIDVVFLLLIFFMTTSSIHETERELDSRASS
jgi:hypothetical protein